MTKDTIEVIYYYRVKDAKVIVHHVDVDTLEKIAKDETKTGKVEESYTTEKLANIPGNYSYVTRTDNYEGIMTEEIIEVTYYYKIATPIIESSIEKEGTIEVVNDPILREEIFNHPTRKFLQVWKENGIDNLLQILVMKNCEAVTWTMATNFEPKNPIMICNN